MKSIKAQEPHIGQNVDDEEEEELDKVVGGVEA